MSFKIVIKADTEQTQRALAAIEKALSPEGLDAVVENVAFRSLLNVVKATPKKWTGQLRREWHMTKPAVGVRVLQNNSKVMKFLEYGTANKGTGFIYPRTAKALFIPLTRKAAMQGWSPALKMQRLVKVPGGGWMFQPGDYLLAKRVRGITPRFIVLNGQLYATALMKTEAAKYIRTVVKQIWGPSQKP